MAFPPGLCWLNRYSLTSGTGQPVICRFLSPKEGVFYGAGQAYAICHKDYYFETDDDDFALIILDNFVDEDITPVELNDDAGIPADGNALETFGW